MTTATTTTIDPAVTEPTVDRRRARIDHHIDVDLHQEGDVLIGRLGGRLDWVTAPPLRQQLTTSSWRALLLDLTELDGLDSQGTGALIRATSEARKRGAGMALVAPDPRIADVLDHVGIGWVVPIVPTVSEARHVLGIPSA